MMKTLRKKAFTLIELLVVIAIISLLVSILLPSLTRAKDLAREVSCAANKRALGMATQFYVEEYDCFIAGWKPQGQPAPQPGWRYHDVLARDFLDFPAAEYSGKHYHRYLGWGAIGGGGYWKRAFEQNGPFRCPGMTMSPVYYTYNQGWNHWLSGRNRDKTQTIDDIDRPSTRVEWTCSGYSRVDGYNGPVDSTAFRGYREPGVTRYGEPGWHPWAGPYLAHYGGFGVSFMDGHVERFTPDNPLYMSNFVND